MKDKAGLLFEVTSHEAFASLRGLVTPLETRERMKNESSVRPGVIGMVPKTFGGSTVSIEFNALAPIEYKSLIITLKPDFKDEFKQANPDWARSAVVDAWFKYFPEVEEAHSTITLNVAFPSLKEDAIIHIGKWGNGQSSPLTLLDPLIIISGNSGRFKRVDYSLFERVS